MRTLLSQFCEEFDAIVRALIQPITATGAALEAASDDLSGRELRPALVDLSHQFETLADKVAEQQAYVLIFGPLKSGKSTLMNAIAATYVSEVTSLPAYPCMVYVSHSETREYTVTRYTGGSETYTDPAALHLAIHRAHGELAERLRAIEDAGKTSEEFDPAVDLPQAIRRIDFKIPAGELAESGAVMVDTPGLYSRMKFGYDRMTRDFRDAAACAIFVVKTDNLFLEQVFAEFNQLLELFSRIFLVVNLDSTKRDLAPDGSLRPSLEQENPLRIIEAFEDLAMSAPLKAAADEGRLKIYPVDLLHSAAERLGGTPTMPDGSPLTPGIEGSRTSFDTFQEDLTSYLNSTDYLVAFLGDSLRRAETLLGELDTVCAHPAIDKLRAEAEGIEGDRARTRGRREALDQLEDHDWAASFGELEASLAEKARAHSRNIEERTTGVLDAAVEAWQQNSDSLETLNRDLIASALRGHQEELLVYLEKTLRDAVRAGDAGLRVAPSLRRLLDQGRLDLVEGGATALAQVVLLGALLDPDVGIEAAEIPVKKGFWDWVLFRGATRVRARLFGPASRPNLRIPAEVKAKRLGKAGREAMLRALDSITGEFFVEASEHLRTAMLAAYTEHAQERVLGELSARKEGVGRRLADLDRQHAEHRAVMDNLERLGAAVRIADTDVARLREHYGSAEPHRLVEPVEDEAPTEPVVMLTPQAPLEDELPLVEEVPEIELEELPGA
ncbi:MAG: GTPase domain-containing protein [Planctomycetota bacterium]|nr:GTPase domain-containing protein [Planctomycetota bacterium]